MTTQIEKRFLVIKSTMFEGATPIKVCSELYEAENLKEAIERMPNTQGLIIDLMEWCKVDGKAVSAEEIWQNSSKDVSAEEIWQNSSNLCW